MNFIRLQSMLIALVLFIFAVAPTHAEEIVQRSVMRGTRYETPYYIKTGAQPGPTVIVIGGLHGDETGGYLAARKIAKWKVTRGRLIVMPDAHREAIRRNVRGYPGNMNNMFPGKANGNDMERLAHEIWKVIENAKPDLLLTLHESRDFHARDSARYGQTFCFDFEELVPSMTRVMRRTNADISPSLHKFLIFVDPFPNCPTYNAWSRLKVPATSIETSRTLPIKTRVRYQLLATQAFFDEWKLGYEQTDVPQLTSASNKPLLNPKVESEATDPDSASGKVISASSSSQTESPILINADNKQKIKNTSFNRIILMAALVVAGAFFGFISWKMSRMRERSGRR